MHNTGHGLGIGRQYLSLSGPPAASREAIIVVETKVKAVYIYMLTNHAIDEPLHIIIIHVGINCHLRLYNRCKCIHVFSETKIH